MGIADLDRVYRNTTYCIDHPAGEIRIRVGEYCAALDVLLRERGVMTWAFVTACNPRSQLLSSDDNARRHAHLVAQVGTLELTMFTGRGRADESEWVEESLLILGIDEAAAVALGAAHEQNAVVVGCVGEVARLRWCLHRAVQSDECGACAI